MAGKGAGQPVYNRRGGRCRDKIRVYANGWGEGGGPEQLAEAARGVVARGFTALKFDPFPGPWRSVRTQAYRSTCTNAAAAQKLFNDRSPKIAPATVEEATLFKSASLLHS